MRKQTRQKQPITGHTLEELTHEEILKCERLNRELLWGFPYDGLRFWARVWIDSHKEFLRLLRYQKSPTMQLMTKMKSLGINYDEWLLQALRRREMAVKHIIEIVKELPEWENWGKYVPGLGAFSFGKLLGIIGNPAAREYPSSLIRHCGLAVKDGKIEKAGKGSKRPYNAAAKSQLWIIVGSFLKAYPKTPSLYGEIYYVWRERFQQKHPDWSTMHCHIAAILKVAKFFVSHLWEVCRKTQGLLIHEPYPIVHLGHKVKLTPQLAMHPRKKIEEVEKAILQVWHLLESEDDEEVRNTHEELLTRLQEKIQGATNSRQVGKGRVKTHTIPKATT